MTDQSLHDKIADHIQGRLKTLYTFGRQLESGNIEWCVRDKNLPDFKDNNVGKPPSGGIAGTVFTSEGADKLHGWILAGEVIEIINQDLEQNKKKIKPWSWWDYVCGTPTALYDPRYPTVIR